MQGLFIAVGVRDPLFADAVQGDDHDSARFRLAWVLAHSKNSKVGRGLLLSANPAL